MEETRPVPAAPEETPATAPEPATPAAPADNPAPPRDCWADLAPGALSQDSQALLAAWMAGRAMPRRTLVRRCIGAAALVGLLACFVNAFRMLLEQEQTSPLSFLPPVFFFVLFEGCLKDLPLRFLLRRALHRLRDGTLYPDRLHLITTRGEKDLAVEDIIMVQRFVGWTVLIWGSWKHPRIVPIPDEACFGEGPQLYGRLQAQVQDARFFRSPRPPRRRRHLIAGLLLMAVALCTQLLVLASVLGPRFYTVPSPDGSTVKLMYLAATQTLSSDSVGNFAYPATGEFNTRWMEGGCCVVTYRDTDDVLRVQLLESAPDTAQRLATDPPKGSWTTFLDSDDPVTLDWDAALPGYRLKTKWGTFVSRQWEDDFDGMGLVLCDDKGHPCWTLTATTFTAANGEGNPVELSGLRLCPVSLSGLDDVPLLGPADSPFLPRGEEGT